MEKSGWRQLVSEASSFRGDGKFPLPAYSEFMPPPRIGVKPYGSFELETPFADDDPWGWTVGVREQQQLQPGLNSIGRQLIENLTSLATGRGAHRIGRHHLKDNPYWPTDLVGSAVFARERHLVLSPLALAKTQDDKGRVRWTLFGGSANGPAKGFWRSFFTAPDSEIREHDALERIRKILAATYHLSPNDLQDLKTAGFRIRPMGPLPARPDWSEGTLPVWVKDFLLEENDVAACRYLLTFTPFAFLPQPIQRAYITGQLNLLPSPTSLVFWGSPLIHRLSKTLPFADQILLLQAIARHEGKGIRVHQSGWLHCAKPGRSDHDWGLGTLQNTFRRTHRWQRVLREDNDAAFAREDHLHSVLFSTHPDDVRLYGKPMARNVQIWSSDFQTVLHGPTAGRKEIKGALQQMEEGGSFGYRFFYPPMQVGQSAVFWHLPLVAFWDAQSNSSNVLDSGLTGYLASTGSAGLSSDHIELWPRLRANGQNGALSQRAKKSESNELFERALGVKRTDPAPSNALSFRQTATRAFEVRYWKTIADLAEGRYLNKNSGDCVNDAATRAKLPHSGSDLDPLADYLLGYYRRLAIRARMADRVLVGDMPFEWKTDFEFPWMGGWKASQQGKKPQRDLITVIPGRNRSAAVIMADHYDTAYMEDIYGERQGIHGDGSRLAARGADDNHSATAALMLGARIFVELSRQGLLECDIWLVHLTGEEFPADCLGARALAERLVERNLQLRQSDGHYLDLSKTNIKGVYVLDMIAHNNEHGLDVFQIAPGTTKESLQLAYHAHEAGQAWGAGVKSWNQNPLRRNLGRGRRSPDSRAVPPIAQHLALRGDVRLHSNPRSTLFNTDGQIFSDAGLPTVLFMENYDINREGYHDSHDTMANVDLDYGAAVAAISIETVAHTACERSR